MLASRPRVKPWNFETGTSRTKADQPELHARHGCHGPGRFDRRDKSPGFRVPPKSVVPNGERLEPEPGNPAVQVRVIENAVLSELSHRDKRPAYSETDIDVRALEAIPPRRLRVWL